MLIKIPNDYKAVETLLKRNGIPYEIVEEKEENKSLLEKILNSINKNNQK